MKNISEILPQFNNWLKYVRNDRDDTIYLRNTILLRFEKDIQKPIKSITLEDIWAWRESLNRKGLTNQTQRTYISSIRIFFQFCYEKKWTSLDFFQIKAPKVVAKRVVYLTPEEIEQFVSVIKSVKYRAIVECLLSTCCRIGELLAINKESIDFENSQVNIIGEKNGLERTVVFTERAMFWLKKYLKTRKDNKSPLFLANTGNRLTRGTVENVIRNYSEASGIEKKITPHIFRHSGATLLYNRTGDIALVKDYLGHQSIEVTDKSYRGVFSPRVIISAKNNLIF